VGVVWVQRVLDLPTGMDDPMTGVAGYAGLNVDHLYKNCPSIAAIKHPICRGPLRPGDLVKGLVDPYGSDICGLCVRRWTSKNGSE